MGIVVKACVLTAHYTVLNVWFIAAVLPLVVLKYWMEMRRRSLATTGRLDAKTYIVTGCNKGECKHYIFLASSAVKRCHVIYMHACCWSACDIVYKVANYTNIAYYLG